MVVGLSKSGDVLSLARTSSLGTKLVTVADKLKALSDSFLTLGIQIQVHGRGTNALLDPFVQKGSLLPGVDLDDLTFLQTIEDERGTNYVKAFASIASQICYDLSKRGQPSTPDIYDVIGRKISEYCGIPDIGYYNLQVAQYLAPLLEKVIAAE